MTPAEIRQKAEGWYAKQIERSSARLGAAWPKHEQWVREYLATELRLRLIAIGWRPKA